MRSYVDTSALVPMFVEEIESDRIERWAVGQRDLVVSRWTLAEFSSALGAKLRRGDIAEEERTRAEAELDSLLPDLTIDEITAADFEFARELSRRSALRAADALHVAIARRIGASLVTFDDLQAETARDLGLTLAL